MNSNKSDHVGGSELHQLLRPGFQKEIYVGRMATSKVREFDQSRLP